MIKRKLVNTIKTFLPILLIVIISAFVFYWTIQLLANIFVPNSPFLFKGVDAFLGALLAFIFVRLGDFLTKIYEREKRHYNAVVYLSTELNSALGILSSNLFILPKFKEAIVRGNVYWGTLNTLPINKAHLNDLYDVKLINVIFTYINHVETINDDIVNIHKGYDDLKNAFIDKKIRAHHYIDNAKEVSKTLSLIEAFLKELVEETERTIALLVLTQYRDKPLGAKILEILIRLNKKEISEADIKSKHKSLKKEIKTVTSEGGKRISRTLKKHGISKLT